MKASGEHVLADRRRTTADTDTQDRGSGGVVADDGVAEVTFELGHAAGGGRAGGSEGWRVCVVGGTAEGGVAAVVDLVPVAGRPTPQVDAGGELVDREPIEGLGQVVSPAEGTEVVRPGLDWWSAVVDGGVSNGVIEVGLPGGGRALREGLVGVEQPERGPQVEWDLVPVDGSYVGGVQHRVSVIRSCRSQLLRWSTLIGPEATGSSDPGHTAAGVAVEGFGGQVQVEHQSRPQPVDR